MAESSRLLKFGRLKYHAIRMVFQRHEASRWFGGGSRNMATRGILLEEIPNDDEATDSARQRLPLGSSSAFARGKHSRRSVPVLSAYFSQRIAATRSISLRRCASRADSTPVLKTFPAVYRAPLCGLERNGRLFPALRADRFCFYALYAS
ncbi:MAG TPA: hypothetical protein VN885_01820 [Candidatus Acidoferrales bacterium]|nr:hypothetical protein [Candidatus Acidoferrales bacterium]